MKIAMPATGLHASPSDSHPSREAGVPAVSVIIPSRNAAAYLRAAIDSALAQTHPVLEVLVIDAGSKDGTQELVESYGPPVRLLDQRKLGRKGIAAARNFGVEAASGEWLAFLDADDWWDPRKTAEQLAALEKSPGAALCYTGIWTVSEITGERTMSPGRDLKAVWPGLRWTNAIATSTVLARRSAVLEVGSFREDLIAFEDWEIWVRLRLRYPFAFRREPLTFYRIVPTSSSHDLKQQLDAIPEVSRSTMVAGLSGWRRWTVRHRLWAAQLYACALLMRENGAGEGGSLLWRSLAHWPLPTFFPIRYKVLLNSLIGRSVWRRLLSSGR
jgi:glycosyltransferase involved in cell wall biosynthesis